MRIVHVGLGASSERNADLFFKQLLGLGKAAPVSLPAELGRAIFGVNRALTIIHYQGDGAHFEVFVDPSYRAPERTVSHSCFEVDGLAEFLKRCGEEGLKARRIPRGDSFVTFISDLDGNLFEVKERK